jgi:hypothetical protein
MELFFSRIHILQQKVLSSLSDKMATVSLTWGDMILAEPSTPPPTKERGWVDAPKKPKKKNATPAAAEVAKKLDFGTPNLGTNSFAALAYDSE